MIMELRASASGKTRRTSGLQHFTSGEAFATFTVRKACPELPMNGVTRAAWLCRDKGRWKVRQGRQQKLVICHLTSPTLLSMLGPDETR